MNFLLILLLFLTISRTEEIVSQFKVHLFKGTLEKFIEQNSYKLEKAFEFEIGRYRLGPNEFKEARIRFVPKEPEKGYVPVVKFQEGEGIQMTFTDLHFDGSGNVGSKIGKFFGSVKTIRVHFRLAPILKNDGHPIDLIPDVRVEQVYADFYKDNMGIEIDGKEMTNPGIRNHIMDWVRNSVDNRGYQVREIFHDLHNQIADLASSLFDTSVFKGKIRLSKMHFYEDFIEIAIRFGFPKFPESDMKTKTGIFKDEHSPNQEGIELIFDENVINTLIYAMYHHNYTFRVREELKSLLDNNPDIEYFFKTRNLMYCWPEINDKYGMKKNIDLRINMASGFPNFTNDYEPPHVHFLGNNKVNLTSTLMIDILIEDKPGHWVEWRKSLSSFFMIVTVHFDYTKKGTKVINNSKIDWWESTNSIVLDPEGNEKPNEQEKAQEFINMNYSRMRYFINKDYPGKKYTLPFLTECGSVGLKYTQAHIYEEFMVLSSNFKLTRRGILCDAPTKIEKAHEHHVDQVQEDVIVHDDL